jgi:(p)ppGpp synthase/HD superfamily hydrolase
MMEMTVSEKIKEPLDLVERAKALAKESHEGLTDKHGYPYFEHLERVAVLVTRFATAVESVTPSGPESSEIDIYVAAAYLHDIIEDTEVTEGDLRIEFRHDELIEVVKILTRGEGVVYSDYIMSIKKSTGKIGEIARVVKLADLFDHLMGPYPCPESLVSRDEKSIYTLSGTKR